MRYGWLAAVVAALGLAVASTAASGLTPVQRGEKALLGRAFTPVFWTTNAYGNAWKRWDGSPKGPPADYGAAFRDYYGLHAAPYPNGELPMGLRETKGLITHGLTTDCLLCHAGSIGGQSYVGLGNASLDIEALFTDLAAADGLPGRVPHRFCNVRGTSEAGAMAVYLLGMREPDLKMRRTYHDFGIRDQMCEDVPAWWLLHKKKTMYYTGGADARSVRSIMQFMLPLNPPSVFVKEEATFADIQAYVNSLRPPKYPLPVDAALAKRGEAVFSQSCARCHGTYGEQWTYPNKVVPIDEIGTDRNRYAGIPEAFGEFYNRTWFSQEKKGLLGDDYKARPATGYQAPPLDGLWATAPYFHNGSAPTVADVLNSKGRPKFFTRSYRTGLEEYDPVKLGWKVRVLDGGADPKASRVERRKVYDTTQPGRGNGGHSYGDDLGDAERAALMEYLKTI
jgi:hypothetical protein